MGILLTVTGECTEDGYLDMAWGTDNMNDEICEAIQDQIDYERMDIKCAHDAYKAVSFDTSAISSVGVNNQSAIQYLLDKTDVVEGYHDEIQASHLNIDYWDDGGCEVKAMSFEDEELDCSKHSFRDTRILKDG